MLAGRRGSTLGSMWNSSSPANDDDARGLVAAMRHRQRPDNEVPVSIALDAVLGEAADFVVYLSGVRAFRALLEFRLTALARHRSGGSGLGGALHGHGEQDDRLLFGVEYADGRTASNLEGLRMGVGSQFDATTPVLWPGGGGGGDRSADMSYYLTPLPPAGALRIITAWPSRGIAETITEIPTATLTDAASRVRVLWDLGPDESPPPPQPPPVPPGSWFDRTQQ